MNTLFSEGAMYVGLSEAQAVTLLSTLFLPLFALYAAYNIIGRGQRNNRNFAVSMLKAAKQPNPTHTVVYLLPDEKGRHLQTPSISTITFFDGRLPVKQLRQRLFQTIKANPFLRSRLVHFEPDDMPRNSSGDKPAAGVCAVYPNEIDEEVDDLDCLKLVKNYNLRDNMNYEELIAQMDSYHAPLGVNCIDRDLPLFRVTLIETEQEKRFAMVVSLSHTIADGFTFYKVYAMLNPAAPLEHIEIRRDFTFVDDMNNNLRFGKGPIQAPCALFGLMCNNHLRGRMKAKIYHVNNEQIESIKKAYKDTNPLGTVPAFLSTNDILTSWFFRFTNTDIGFIMANFRNRIARLTNAMGGNYQGRIMYTKCDMQSPALIRRSLENFRSVSNATPSPLTIAQLNVTLVTNWATFYSEVCFDHCQQVNHFPIIQVNGSGLRNCMVIYQASADKTGVILWTRGLTQEAFDAEKILSAK